MFLRPFNHFVSNWSPLYTSFPTNLSPLNHDGYPYCTRSRYPAIPSPAMHRHAPAVGEGRRRADQATREGVTDQPYCSQVGRMSPPGQTSRPQRTPPRNWKFQEQLPLEFFLFYFPRSWEIKLCVWKRYSKISYTVWWDVFKNHLLVSVDLWWWK